MAKSPYVRFVGEDGPDLIIEHKSGAQYRVRAPRLLPDGVRRKVECVDFPLDDGPDEAQYVVTLTDKKLGVQVEGDGNDRAGAHAAAEEAYWAALKALPRPQVGAEDDNDNLPKQKGKKVYYDDETDQPYVLAGPVKTRAVNLSLLLRRGIKKQGATTYAVSKVTGIPESVLSRFRKDKGDLSLKNAGKLMGVLGMKVKTVYMSRRVWTATSDLETDKRRRHELVPRSEVSG